MPLRGIAARLENAQHARQHPGRRLGYAETISALDQKEGVASTLHLVASLRSLQRMWG
jgi:hypothetical protein